MVCLYLQEEFPKILIAFIDGGEGEDRDEGDESEDGDESEEDPFDATISSQRCNFTWDE
jgi:hypothetical protein